ncbi:MAG: trans-aconitate 2-methyltransferase [Actinomycetota bacterium]|jgi:trans-aconitate 2-methyltransferase|nr:trans-aconitate 2-methyltransferase [Actinomycetota bacterium]
MWDATEYLRFAGHRGRPFLDLVARVPAEAPASIVDLGCGPGNMTVTLAERWPEASVEGVDSSAEMIERARTDHGAAADGRVRFTRADLRDWSPTDPVDLLMSNATFQWVPGHLELLAQLVAGVRPGGWFAFQVPGNFGEPSHTELAAVCEQPRWRERFAGAELARPWVAEPIEYLERLTALGAEVDVWETTYLHVLQGEDAVLRWISGTGLRPVLDVLDEQEQAQFTADYGARLRAAYPQQGFGTVLPYRRIFAVAQVGGVA